MNQLPTTLGPVEFTPTNIRLWCVNPSRFDPILHFAPPPTEEPLLQPTAAPQQPPSTSFIPSEYQLHLHSSYCAHCGHASEWACIYARELRSARLNAGAPVDHLIRVDRFSYNIPLITVRVPTTTVPACSECATTISLSALPSPPKTDSRILNWIAAKSTPQPTAISTALADAVKSKKRKFTIDDLI